MQIKIIPPKHSTDKTMATIDLTKYGPRSRWNLCRHTQRRPGKYMCIGDQCQKLKLDLELRRLGIKRLTSYYWMASLNFNNDYFYAVPVTLDD